MLHRAVFIDSALVMDEQLLLGAYKYQYFQALDNLAVDNGLPFLEFEQKDALFEETTKGYLYARDGFTGCLDLAKPIYKAFGVDEFSQRSINKAAEWVKEGMRLSDTALRFLSQINIVAQARESAPSSVEDEPVNYGVSVTLLSEEDEHIIYYAVGSKHGELGLIYANETKAGLFTDDRHDPALDFESFLKEGYPGVSYSDCCYITANKIKFERARELGIERSILVARPPKNELEPDHSYAHLATEVRAFLFEREEGGLIPNKPGDDAPEYIGPSFLN